MKKIFIDGSAGTTGLRIRERLADRTDITILSLPEADRKNPQAKKEQMNRADVVFLCLPDDAARESAALVENDSTAVIDTSTAHRTSEGWTYGFPEIGGRRDCIRTAKHIANPGCHASGFIALIAPLTECGLLSPDRSLTCFSLTGYSGGGKKMIAQYEAENRDFLLDAPRLYGLTQTHKHLPEMKKICGLEREPVFCPVVAPFLAGMEVCVSLFREDIPNGIDAVRTVFREYYSDGLVRYLPDGDEDGFLSAGRMTGRDDMLIGVYGNDDRMVLVSRFDNLGKGASGAAIQNMNLLIGAEETTGLNIGGF